MSEVTLGSLRDLFTFPFRDPEWQTRFMVGAVLVLVSFILPIPLIRWIPWIVVSGYTLQILRQTIAGEAPHLPAWDDWGQLTSDGLRSFAVTLVYMLPGTLVFFGGMGFYFVVSFALPFIMESTNDESIVMLGIILMFGSMAILFVSMFIGWVLFLVGILPMPVARAHFVAQDKLAVAFNLRQWWAILRADLMGYFVAWVVLAGLGVVLYIVYVLAYLSVILCCLTPFLIAPAGFYVFLVSAALFGQTYRQSAARLAEMRGAES